METKPSVYTMEFWAHNVIQVLLWINTAHIWAYLPGQWGKITTAAASAVLAGLFAISRGIAKSNGVFDPNLPANFKLFPKRADLTRR